MGSRNWCFTINNPEECELNLDAPCIKTLIANRELGENGTPHLQGYLETTHPIRLNQLKNWNGKGHYESRKGNRLQAIKYCIKDYFIDELVNPIYRDDSLRLLEEYGLVTKGWNKDWTLDMLLESIDSVKTDKLKQLMQLLKAGATELQIAEEDPGTWARNYKALERYKRLITTQRSHAMEVIVIYGPTGTGKSKYCYDNYPGAYWKQRSNWWDGYENEHTVILDEYYGWLPYDTLLRICDRYPLLIETKGGQKQFTSKRIVITSNNIPSKWYKESLNLEPLKRRIGLFIFMEKLGDIKYATNYDDFIDLTLSRPVYDILNP